ncbi:hypothetical protein ACAG26_02895 [Mycobacterium sp. pUA109]|uniref:hypothetical protein n=1 Tax=Mycobacterium sp. pUA109 TaxID=3238982 RepID=UPI00351B3285
MPSLEIVDRVLGRDRDVLEQIAADIGWPTQYQRVIVAARGLYRGGAQRADLVGVPSDDAPGHHTHSGGSGWVSVPRRMSGDAASRKGAAQLPQ